MMTMKKKIMKTTILLQTKDKSITIFFTFTSLHSSSFVITHRKIPTFWMRRICLGIHIITVRYLIFTADINKIIVNLLVIKTDAKKLFACFSQKITSFIISESGPTQKIERVQQFELHFVVLKLFFFNIPCVSLSICLNNGTS